MTRVAPVLAAAFCCGLAAVAAAAPTAGGSSSSGLRAEPQVSSADVEFVERFLDSMFDDVHSDVPMEHFDRYVGTYHWLRAAAPHVCDQIRRRNTCHRPEPVRPSARPPVSGQSRGRDARHHHDAQLLLEPTGAGSDPRQGRKRPRQDGRGGHPSASGDDVDSCAAHTHCTLVQHPGYPGHYVCSSNIGRTWYPVDESSRVRSLNLQQHQVEVFCGKFFVGDQEHVGNQLLNAVTQEIHLDIDVVKSAVIFWQQLVAEGRPDEYPVRLKINSLRRILAARASIHDVLAANLFEG